MDNARHTPGPWVLQPIGDETECNVLGAGRELIATVADCDAALIAAAPELLAALRALVGAQDAIDAGTVADCLGRDAAIGAARAAIAKAEGGAA